MNQVDSLPLVRLSAINPFLQELLARNLDACALLEKLGLPPGIPASPELFVAAPSLYRFVEESAVLANDPYFGARLGQNLDLLAWDPTSEAAEEAATVGELLNHFIVRSRQHASSIDFLIETSGDRTTFATARVLAPKYAPAQNDAFYVGFMSKLIRSACGTHWLPAKVLVTLSDPSVIPPEFPEMRLARGDNRGIRFVFPTEWLFARFEKASFAAHAKHRTEFTAPRSLLESVRIAIEPHIHECDLTVGKAAELCGLEKRHLSRRLKKKGTTLAKEIAKLRRARAAKALKESNVRVADVGISVGFTDPTVFSRAFKNWTGQSPQAYRRNHRINQD